MKMLKLNETPIFHLHTKSEIGSGFFILVERMNIQGDKKKVTFQKFLLCFEEWMIELNTD